MIAQTSKHTPPHIPVAILGWSLGIFLAISFVACVVFGLIFSGATMYQAWLPLLPGVSWMSWGSFILGVIETFAYGWYVALIFAPLFNFFAARAAK